MKKIFLSEHRLQLFQRLSEIESSMNHIQAELLEASESHTNSFQDFLDYTKEQNDLNAQLEMYERYTYERREILSALDRIKQGSFGECNECGEMIAAKRLSVQPSSALCVECQHLKEVYIGLDIDSLQETDPSSLTFLFDSVEVA